MYPENSAHEESTERVCTCLDGWHYIGHMVESADDLDGEVELYEQVPCRRCQREDSYGRA
jgi:hypothetical protein